MTVSNKLPFHKVVLWVALTVTYQSATMALMIFSWIFLHAASTIITLINQNPPNIIIFIIFTIYFILPHAIALIVIMFWGRIKTGKFFNLDQMIPLGFSFLIVIIYNIVTGKFLSELQGYNIQNYHDDPQGGIMVIGFALWCLLIIAVPQLIIKISRNKKAKKHPEQFAKEQADHEKDKKELRESLENMFNSNDHHDNNQNPKF